MSSPSNDWRSTVQQSYRNKQVRDIAKFLASIDKPGTTVASKFKLAYQLEDKFFKSAGSLDKYHSKINKHLGKFEKTWKAKLAEDAKKEAAAAAAAGLQGTTNEQDTPKFKELYSSLLKELGPSIVYIYDTAPAAIKAIHDGTTGQPADPEKAAKLKKNTDATQLVGEKLGILTPAPLSSATASTASVSNTKSDGTAGATTVDSRKTSVQVHRNFNDTSKIKPTIQKYEELEKIGNLMKRNVAGFRQYVMRYGDPDAAALEALLERDQNYRGSDATNGRTKEKASFFLSKWIHELSKSQQPPPQPSATALQESSRRAKGAFLNHYNGTMQHIPPPTRDNKRETETGLSHVAKLRAAADALEEYFKISNRHDGTLFPTSKSTTTTPSSNHSTTGGGVGNNVTNVGSSDINTVTLTKIHQTVLDGTKYCATLLKERQKEQTGNDEDNDEEKNPEDDVKLEDAWTKSLLEVHNEDGETKEVITIDDDDDDDGTSSPAAKKQKSSHNDGSSTPKRAYIKAKMLLQNPKKPATNQLLTALARKRARLNQRLAVPSNNNSNDIMATHLVLEFGKAFEMTIWLSPLMVQIRAIPQSDSDGDAVTNSKSRSNVSTTATLQSAWKPLSYGLTGSSNLSVYGVTGDYTALGRVVEERLRDASTEATYALRRSFSKHVKDKILPIEVEILETSALMDFLHLARTTYIPGWQDIDN